MFCYWIFSNIFTLAQTWAFKQDRVRKALNIRLVDPALKLERERQKLVDAEFRMMGYGTAFRKLVADGRMMGLMKKFNQQTLK